MDPLTAYIALVLSLGRSEENVFLYAVYLKIYLLIYGVTRHHEFL